MSCCESKPAFGVGRGGGGGGGDTHENVGTGPDVYLPPSSSPASFRRLRTYDRGVPSNDLLGGLEVLDDPADSANTRLARWKNVYKEDLTLSSSSSSVFQTASSWAISGADGNETFVWWYSALVCVSFDITEVRLLVNGVIVDLWRTNEDVIPPSAPQTRLVKNTLVAAPDPFTVELQYRSVFGTETSFVENKTLFGLRYSD